VFTASDAVANRNRVAVGLGLRDVFVADVGAGAALVLDHDLLTPLRREPFGEHACDDIGRAAGGDRHDEAHGFMRVIGLRCLRARLGNEEARRECQRGRQGNQVTTGQHGGTPVVGLDAGTLALNRGSPYSAKGRACRWSSPATRSPSASSSPLGWSRRSPLGGAASIPAAADVTAASCHNRKFVI
jgi:hypothetical protein